MPPRTAGQERWRRAANRPRAEQTPPPEIDPMDRRTFLSMAGAAALCGGRALSQNPGFRPLYNGKDLKGWHVKDGRQDVWQADGPTLRCSGGGGGWLTNDRGYSDFELHVDWKIEPGGNSGVGIRYPAEG